MFQVGQKFKEYTPEIAIWCNKNGYYIEKENGFYVIKAKSSEEQLAEAKQLKKLQLKEARDNYLISKGYNLSDNDKFNIINLIGGYTEQDRNKYLYFLNNDLIPKYNHYSKLIDDGVDVEEVEGIEIEFIPPATSETEENDDEEEKDINNNNDNENEAEK